MSFGDPVSADQLLLQIVLAAVVLFAVASEFYRRYFREANLRKMAKGCE